MIRSTATVKIKTSIKCKKLVINAKKSLNDPVDNVD